MERLRVLLEQRHHGSGFLGGRQGYLFELVCLTTVLLHLVIFMDVCYICLMVETYNQSCWPWAILDCSFTVVATPLFSRPRRSLVQRGGRTMALRNGFFGPLLWQHASHGQRLLRAAGEESHLRWSCLYGGRQHGWSCGRRVPVSWSVACSWGTFGM